jgi:2,3-bisphosphoglycerate-dependent phosphoglycerate mutase
VITYLLRHGQTSLSVTYRVNGDPRLAVSLDDTGREQCRRARAAIPVAEIRSCVTSEFPRAVETGELILQGAKVPVTTDQRLNELDYGAFEARLFSEYAAWLRQHGPLGRPPGATESQREGIRRMLDGLRSALTLRGPRLVVTHGLALSVISWRQRHALAEEAILFPEAPCATPMLLADADLRRTIDALTVDLGRETHRDLGDQRNCAWWQAEGLLGSTAEKPMETEDR